MNTNVWTEAGGDILRQALRQEARRLHQVHQPPTRLKEWAALRKRLRAQLLGAAGTFPAPPPLAVREHGTLAMEGYRIVKLTYQSRPDLRVTANLYVPDGPGPFPAVLNLHGHWNQGKIAARVAARGHTLAREGFVCLTVDAIGAGERGTRPGQFEYHGFQQGVSLLSVGETLLGMQVYDNMRAIDLLQSLNYVDGERIGVTGASGGGNQTMWVAALDPRVKAAVPVVSVGTFESYVTEVNCWCEVLPDGLTLTEEWGVLALVAPNPLLILNAVQDNNPTFAVKEMLRSYGAAREIYRLHGVEERIACQAIDLPHGFWPEMRRHMLGWFKYWLKGEGNGWPCAIPEVPELPEPDLLCFPGKRRPADVKSLVEYVSIRTQALKQDLLSQRTLNRSAKTRALRRLLRLPGDSAPGRCSTAVAGEAEGRRFEKFSVQADGQALIPCTLLLPDTGKPSVVVIAAHRDGKDACLKESAAQAVLAQGKALCLVDLRHTGETAWEPPEAEHRVSTRALLWLGRTLMGDWVQDLLAVCDAIQQRGQVRGVELLGFGEPALAVLAAAALERRFSGLTVENLLSTYVVDAVAPVQRYGIFVPGMLRWGDVSLLAAMARCPVRVNSLVHPAGTGLAARERTAWFLEVRRLTRRLDVTPRRGR
jgi:dienelactone hydrolase